MIFLTDSNPWHFENPATAFDPNSFKITPMSPSYLPPRQLWSHIEYSGQDYIDSSKKHQYFPYPIWNCPYHQNYLGSIFWRYLWKFGLMNFYSHHHHFHGTQKAKWWCQSSWGFQFLFPVSPTVSFPRLTKFSLKNKTNLARKI